MTGRTSKSATVAKKAAVKRVRPVSRNDGARMPNAASQTIDQRIRELGDWRGPVLKRMRELIHQAGLYGNLCRLAPACGVVFTKLDECLSLGCVYNLARRLDAPVSYVCDGQVIPDHIALATPRSVATRVLSAVSAAPAPVAAGGRRMRPAGVPMSTIRPWSMMATRLQRRSASSIRCVVRTTVLPRA